VEKRATLAPGGSTWLVEFIESEGEALAGRDGSETAAKLLLATLGSLGAIRPDLRTSYVQGKKAIGSGANAEVFKAELRKFSSRKGGDGFVCPADPEEVKKLAAADAGAEASSPVAIKVLNPIADANGDDQKLAETICREVALVAASQGHPNIVKLFGLFRAPHKATPQKEDKEPKQDAQAPREPQEVMSWSIAMEFCDCGDLFDAVVKKCFSEEHAMKMMTGLLGALVHIHSRGIIHRDVKVENVLLRHDGQPVLADFGVACRDTDSEERSPRCGSPGYAAPEILCGAPYDVKVDVFSTGVVLHFMLSGKTPFQGSCVASTLRRTVRQEVDYKHRHFATVSDATKDFGLKLLQKSPKARPSAEAALAILVASAAQETLKLARDLHEKLEVSPKEVEVRWANKVGTTDLQEEAKVLEAKAPSQPRSTEPGPRSDLMKKEKETRSTAVPSSVSTSTTVADVRDGRRSFLDGPSVSSMSMTHANSNGSTGHHVVRRSLLNRPLRRQVSEAADGTKSAELPNRGDRKPSFDIVYQTADGDGEQRGTRGSFHQIRSSFGSTFRRLVRGPKDDVKTQSGLSAASVATSVARPPQKAVPHQFNTDKTGDSHRKLRFRSIGQGQKARAGEANNQDDAHDAREGGDQKPVTGEKEAGARDDDMPDYPFQGQSLSDYEGRATWNRDSRQVSDREDMDWKSWGSFSSFTSSVCRGSFSSAARRHFSVGSDSVGHRDSMHSVVSSDGGVAPRLRHPGHLPHGIGKVASARTREPSDEIKDDDGDDDRLTTMGWSPSDGCTSSPSDGCESLEPCAIRCRGRR